MTPAQQRALEFVLASPLTPAQIDAISPLLNWNQRQDMAIAAILSVGRYRLQPVEIGATEVLSCLGLTVGNALLDLISRTQEFRHVKALLESGRLRLDSGLTKTVIDNLVGFELAPDLLFTKSFADAIFGLAKVSDPISFNEVSDALNLAEGRVTL